VLPGVIQGHRAPAPTASRHYTVTVEQLGSTAKGGVIGSGTINNKHWRAVLDKTMGTNQGCGATVYLLTCGPNPGGPVGPRDVNLGLAGAGSTQFEYGPVGSAVTRVVVRLGNGTVLDLSPVTAYGHRWVAMAAPVHSVVEAESFVGGAEYRYAIPYVSNSFSEFVMWLGLGQVGLPRSSARVGSGKLGGVAWRETVSVGPWGYCAAFADSSMCIPTAIRPQLPRIGKPLALLSCEPLSPKSGKRIGSEGVGLLPAGVKNVVLKFADGTHLRLVAAYVGRTRSFGYAIPNHPKVVSTLEYGFAGQLVGSASGTNWNC
jgi:hypothetical protein